MQVNLTAFLGRYNFPNSFEEQNKYNRSIIIEESKSYSPTPTKGTGPACFMEDQLIFKE